MYGCIVDELRNDHRDTRITSLEGQHEQPMSNDDVISIWIENISTVEFITNDFFAKFPNTQNFVMHYTPLKHLFRGDFVMADNLVNIFVTHTDLTDLEDYVFYATKVVKTLNLRDNNIRNISEHAFKGLTTVQFLTLSRNRLISLHVNLFTDLHFLRQLSLSNNRLQHIPQSLFKENRNLEVIFLDHNELKSLNGNMFDRNNKLREIYIDNNQIKHISNIPNFLVNLNSLEIAVFNNNTCVDLLIYIMSKKPPFHLIFKNC